MALTDFILHFLQLQRYTINARIYKFYGNDIHVVPVNYRERAR